MFQMFQPFSFLIILFLISTMHGFPFIGFLQSQFVWKFFSQYRFGHKLLPNSRLPPLPHFQSLQLFRTNKKEIENKFIVLWRPCLKMELLKEDLRAHNLSYIFVNIDENEHCRKMFGNNTKIPLPIVYLNDKIIGNTLFDIYSEIYKND